MFIVVKLKEAPEYRVRGNGIRGTTVGVKRKVQEMLFYIMKMVLFTRVFMIFSYKKILNTSLTQSLSQYAQL